MNRNIKKLSGFSLLRYFLADKDFEEFFYYLNIFLLGAPPYQILVKFSSEKSVIGSYNIPVSFNFQTVGDNVDTFTIARNLVSTSWIRFPSSTIYCQTSYKT